MNTPIAKRVFHALWIHPFYKGVYTVTNDLNYYATIYADNDVEAIEKFMKGEY